MLSITASFLVQAICWFNSVTIGRQSASAMELVMPCCCLADFVRIYIVHATLYTLQRNSLGSFNVCL